MIKQSLLLSKDFEPVALVKQIVGPHPYYYLKNYLVMNYFHFDLMNFKFVI